ncbi:hypothetical protein H8958_021348 [Nasalis larvatus]
MSSPVSTPQNAGHSWVPGHWSVLFHFRKRTIKYKGDKGILTPSHRQVDRLVQALGSGCPPKKSLSYRNKEVGVDVCAVPPEHRAFLHPERDENFPFPHRHPHGLAILDSYKHRDHHSLFLLGLSCSPADHTGRYDDGATATTSPTGGTHHKRACVDGFLIKTRKMVT